MKKILFLFCMCISGVAVAQETIVLPSSFDENQMIVKEMDEEGNFIPVNQVEGVVDDSQQTTQQQSDQIEKDNSEEEENRRRIAPKEKVLPKNISEDPQKLKRVRKMKAIKRDYGIQKTTFGADTYEKVETPKKPTFKMPTMTKAFDDFRRESVHYEDCSSDDPDCRMYEVDEKGQVIF